MNRAYLSFVGVLLALQGTRAPAESKPAPDPKDVYIFHFAGIPGNPAASETVLDLLNQFATFMAGSFMMDDDVARALQRAIVDIRGPVTVPKASAGEFLETILASHGFALTTIGRESLGLRKVYFAKATANERIHETAMIDAKDIDHYAGRAATVVTVAVPVRHASPEAICKSVNTVEYFPSTLRWGSPIPMGDHAILISGLAPDVAKLAKFIAAADKVEEEASSDREIKLRQYIEELEGRVRALEEKGSASKPGGK
jgi:hypothetical protein